MGSGEGVAGRLARRVALAGLGERALEPDGRHGAAGNQRIRPDGLERRVAAIAEGLSTPTNDDPDVSPASEIGPEEVARCIPLAGRLSPTVDSRDRVIPDVGMAVRHVEQALDPDLDQGRVGNDAKGDGSDVSIA